MMKGQNRKERSSRTTGGKVIRRLGQSLTPARKIAYEFQAAPALAKNRFLSCEKAAFSPLKSFFSFIGWRQSGDGSPFRIFHIDTTNWFQAK
jgi:hypothetical protein